MSFNPLRFRRLILKKETSMSNCHDDDHHISKGRWVFYAFLVMGGVLLFTEHRAHLLGILPYLFLLACPLMHLFMHHGHGGDSHDGHDSKTVKGEKE